MCFQRPFVVLVGVFWLLGVTVTSGQHRLREEQELKPNQQKSIVTVLKKHTDALIALPGVVGTAIGECGGRPCIKVYVAKKTPELLNKIPSSLDGYPVEVQETGQIRALDPS